MSSVRQVQDSSCWLCRYVWPAVQGEPSLSAAAKLLRLRLRRRPTTPSRLAALQLFELHRKAAMRKSAVEFLHVSKSGGSSLCAAAVHSGCRAALDDNCLVPHWLDDAPRWVQPDQVQGRLESTVGIPGWVGAAAPVLL